MVDPRLPFSTGGGKLTVTRVPLGKRSRGSEVMSGILRASSSSLVIGHLACLSIQKMLASRCAVLGAMTYETSAFEIRAGLGLVCVQHPLAGIVMTWLP